MLFTDWNNSGTASLRMANDREYYEGGQEQMWQVLPGQPPKLYGKEDGWAYLRIWGMGIAGYDLDGDGYQEYAITSMADNKLQVLLVLGPHGGELLPEAGAEAARPHPRPSTRPVGRAASRHGSGS